VSWTKRQLISQGLEEIGLASYVFSLTADQYASAARVLDSMMATWSTRGIVVGYPIASDPANIDIDADTGIPDGAAEAIWLNFAIRRAPAFGKTVAAETRAAAKSALDALLLEVAKPVEMQFPNTLPVGAGNRSWRTTANPYMPTPTDPITTGSGGQLEF
jgi:hypothetical protein